MGPLTGIRVLELASIGPVPFCGMLLADLGAEVVRVDRVHEEPRGGGYTRQSDLVYRGTRSVAIDLKHPSGRGVVLDLVEHADILLEGFRPGVTERLGIGPDECLVRNPVLVYGRTTGWGQTGPYAAKAGHDLNYIAITGVLHAIGPGDRPPTPPLNLIGDYGGGGMLLAVGVVSALLESRSSGEGQVVDAAMTDGAALLGTSLYSAWSNGLWCADRGTNVFDGGAPFYQVYETCDGKYVAVAAMEPEFYARLLDGCGLVADELPDQWDRESWPAMKERLELVFRSRTRDDWCERFDTRDACFAPVLSPAEAHLDPHIAARATLVDHGGVVQPAPAPRFSRTPAALGGQPPKLGEHTVEVLEQWGLERVDIARLLETGAVLQRGQGS